MNNIWFILQSVLAILIIVSVLLQSQGGGLGAAFGGGGDNYHTRRGLEKVLFNATIVLILLFAVVSIGSLMAQ